ncbi:ABC-ATPase domain-containing protein [Corynebacterium uterequi]|uniref:Putative ATPase of the ABC class n=1 Tax=Corynebacterium uterequi TaxID=1072256 RepID=A0A0G3HLH9_9CORY|nr:ABC-ATPase domain-containing protein [Corynebacterium uterequi]AKK11992.1 putative ATPase of the ABC class [Corynebacterium uterequi]
MSLAATLRSLDGAGYGAYKKLRGRHRVGELTVYIDRVQSDPFAPPSQLRIHTQFPQLSAAQRCPTAAADLLARRLHAALPRGDKRTGQLHIDAPGQQVLDATAVRLLDTGLEIRIEATLPANGRRIRGHAAAELLTRTLPAALDDALAVDAAELDAACELFLDQEALRQELSSRGLVAFVADGSILPRRSGDSDLPLAGAVAFRAPSSLRVAIELPSGATVTGLGIPEGITVIAGGGFHGKSTLLRALQLGVYNHRRGDGREFAITRADAVSLRAEDGRAVTCVDISPFITNLPTHADTTSFSTTNASGSTSQAAWLMEALEARASCLLIDEDTSATNFMIRDERMRALVPDSREPITPLLHRIRSLRDDLGVSTVLITGGTSAFLDVADTVIVMDAYQPLDATDTAHGLASPLSAVSSAISAPRPRTGAQLHPRLDGRKPPQAKSLHTIRVGRGELDLSACGQLVHPSQTRAIAAALPGLVELLDDGATVLQACEEMAATFPGQARSGRLARVRPFELLFAVSHLR